LSAQVPEVSLNPKPETRNPKPDTKLIAVEAYVERAAAATELATEFVAAAASTRHRTCSSFWNSAGHRTRHSAPELN
jgi:hypothetical protein